MSKLSEKKFMDVYVTYIGRYVTEIFTNTDKIVHQNDGFYLNDEGMRILLKLKFDGYELPEYGDWEFCI